MIMEEMTLEQVALAAECITLARLEFVKAVVLDPAISILEQVAGVKVESTDAETEATREEKARAARRKKRGPRRKKKTPEERDAAILAMAASLGLPIEEEKGGG